MSTKIYNINGLYDGQFSLMPHPGGGAALADEAGNWKANGVDIVISMLTLEEQRDLDLLEEGLLCQRYGITFLNYPIRDEVADSIDKTVEFIDVLEGFLSRKNHFLFHCRGGVGRSSMMLTLLAGRLGVRADKSFELISKSRGEEAPESQYQKQWINSILNK